MKKLLLLLPLTLAALATASYLPRASGVSTSAEASATRFMILDVACDGRTFYRNRVDPAATTAARGDSFVVHGKIYPGQTIPAGGTTTSPVFSPDEPGSMGDWVCRGTFLVNSADMAAGVAPHFASTQIYLLDDGTGLVTEGLEGGITTTRAVTGGMGRFSNGFDAVGGEATEEILGRNSTGLLNFRLTFRLKKNLQE